MSRLACVFVFYMVFPAAIAQTSYFGSYSTNLHTDCPACAWVNEQTSSCTCPAGSTAILVASVINDCTGGGSQRAATIYSCFNGNAALDFAGGYQKLQSTGECLTTNPVTGGCNCGSADPIGPFITILRINSNYVPTHIFFCYRDLLANRATFGGAHQMDDSVAGGIACRVPNPLTGGCTCPSPGYAAMIRVAVATNIGSRIMMCYRFPPTAVPTRTPTRPPTVIPTRNPTRTPTRAPTASPSQQHTHLPSRVPTSSPSVVPSRLPSLTQTTLLPSSATPTSSPISTLPTVTPSPPPSATPSLTPSSSPHKRVSLSLSHPSLNTLCLGHQRYTIYSDHSLSSTLFFTGDIHADGTLSDVADNPLVQLLNRTIFERGRSGNWSLPEQTSVPPPVISPLSGSPTNTTVLLDSPAASVIIGQARFFTTPASSHTLHVSGQLVASCSNVNLFRHPLVLALFAALNAVPEERNNELTGFVLPAVDPLPPSSSATLAQRSSFNLAAHFASIRFGSLDDAPRFSTRDDVPGVLFISGALAADLSSCDLRFNPALLQLRSLLEQEEIP